MRVYSVYTSGPGLTVPADNYHQDNYPQGRPHWPGLTEEFLKFATINNNAKLRRACYLGADKAGEETWLPTTTHTPWLDRPAPWTSVDKTGIESILGGYFTREIARNASLA